MLSPRRLNSMPFETAISYVLTYSCQKGFAQGRYHHNHHQVDGVLVSGSQTHKQCNSIDQLAKCQPKKAVHVKIVPSSIIYHNNKHDSSMHEIALTMFVFVMILKLIVIMLSEMISEKIKIHLTSPISFKGHTNQVSFHTFYANFEISLNNNIILK